LDLRPSDLLARGFQLLDGLVAARHGSLAAALGPEMVLTPNPQIIQKLTSVVWAVEGVNITLSFQSNDADLCITLTNF